MMSLVSTVVWVAVLAATTPTPSSSEAPDPDSISPGVTGFIATFALVVACLLLFVSMARRVRRMQYRAEHDEAEHDERADDGTAAGPAGTGSGTGTGTDAGDDDRGDR